MAAVYEIWLQDALGNTLDVIDDWFSLSYTRAVNDIGGLELQLDGDYPLYNVKVDGRILVYRDGRLEIDAPWLIRKWEKRLDENGVKTLTLYGVSANEILTRRVILANDSGEESIGDYPDNMMKAIVRAQFFDPDTAYRDISAYLSVEADASLGISASKKFQYANVFDTLQEITQSSISDGSAIYFDVVSTTSSGLEFRTYPTLRGINHTFPGGINPVTLSPDYGNLSNVTLSFDRSQEITQAVVAGQGASDSRFQIIRTASTRATESPLNLRESFSPANNTNDSDKVTTEAQAALRAGRPVRTLEGQLVNVPGTCEYRVHWSLGDAVTATLDGDSFDCTIDAVSVSVRAGKEEITGTLRVEEQ